MTMTMTMDDGRWTTRGTTPTGMTERLTTSATAKDRAPAAPVFGAAFASGGFGAAASGGFDPSKFASKAKGTNEAEGDAGEGARATRRRTSRRSAPRSLNPW